MLYGSSTDPVFIKKINLKVWKLRDEIEAVIAERSKTLGKNISIDDLIEEYRNTPVSNDGAGAEVISMGNEPDPSLSDDESEMAALLAGGDDDNEENSEEANEENSEDAATDEGESDEDADAAAMAAAMLEGQGGADESSDAAEEPVNQTDNAGESKEIKQRILSLPEEKLCHAKTILSEVEMEKIFFFTTTQFQEGTSVVIEFDIPKKFRVSAEILYCRAYNLKSRIISERKIPFRTLAKFTFMRPGERTMLRQFLESVEPEVMEVAPPPKAAASADNEDFDELDDFDI